MEDPLTILEADCVRERLSSEGIEAVIPPISSHVKVIAYDKERCRRRNRAERFFDKIKNFRRITTRYDKLSKAFCAAILRRSGIIVIDENWIAWEKPQRKRYAVVLHFFPAAGHCRIRGKIVLMRRFAERWFGGRQLNGCSRVRDKAYLHI